MLVGGEFRGEVGRKGGGLGGSREVDFFNVSYVRILGLESASRISHSDEVGGRRNMTRMRWGKYTYDDGGFVRLQRTQV